MIRRRHKVLIVLGSLWVLLLIAVSLIPSTFFLESFRQLETERSSRALSSLHERIDSEFENLRTNLVTWAYWDDAYQAVQNMTPAFIHSNLAEPSIFDFGMNLILFVNHRGEFKAARHYDLELRERKSLPQDLKKKFRERPELWKHQTTDSSFKGFIELDDKIYFVVSLPILTSEKKGPFRGSLIFGRILSTAFAESLSKRMQMKAELVRSPSEDPIPENWTRVTYPVVDPSGKNLAALEVSFRQDILMQGHTSLRALIAWLWLAGLVFALSVIIYLDRNVFPRIDKAEFRLFEMERLNAQLRKAQIHLIQTQKFESVSALAKGVAHDLNNLIGSIFGALSVLERDFKGRADIFKRLDVISRAAQGVSELAKKLVQLTRHTPHEKEVFSISEIISDTQSSLSKSVRHDIRIRTDIPRNIWKVEGDRAGLFQLLMNLGMNASDAIPAEGEIVFHAENIEADERFCASVQGLSPGKYIRVKVVDTGVGIPAEAQTKIFDPFVSTKPDGAGAGLGLSVAYSIARDHGGLLTCYSAPALGTIFSLYIPATDDEPVIELMPLQFHENKIATHETFNGRLILVADDDYLSRELARDILEEEGAVVLTAESGQQALEMFLEHRDQLALIILDIIMPEMGGVEAHEKMKEIDPNIAILFASGGTDFSSSIPLLQKPFRRKELLELVWAAINNRELKLKAHA